MNSPIKGVSVFILALAAGWSPALGSQASWPDISSPARAVGGGEHDAAVVVGAENYFKVERVVGAKQNANDWQAYLTGTLKVPPGRVTLLLDDDATADQMLQAAAEKAGEVEPGGTLWFVFIGHGAPSKNGKDGLLVGVDAQQKAASVYSRSLSRNELLATLAKGKQAKTVVLLDACFSGKSPSGEALVSGLQPLVTMSALPAWTDNRTILMTAAKSDQFAGPLPGGARPAFSYLALGALRGWAADAKGVVTASGLLDYVRQALSLARDRTQTPELSTPETAQAVLGKGHEAGPDMAGLQREAAASAGTGSSSSPASGKTGTSGDTSNSDSVAMKDFRDLRIVVKSVRSFRAQGPYQNSPSIPMIQLTFELTNRNPNTPLLVALNGIGGNNQSPGPRSQLLDSSGQSWTPGKVSGLTLIRAVGGAQDSSQIIRNLKMGGHSEYNQFGRDYDWGGSFTEIPEGQSIMATMAFANQRDASEKGTSPSSYQFSGEVVVGEGTTDRPEKCSLLNLMFDELKAAK